MKNMLSRNSFPQICVVSVIECVGNEAIQQEYVRSGHYVTRIFKSLVKSWKQNCRIRLAEHSIAT
jgi:hypothetical protein